MRILLVTMVVISGLLFLACSTPPTATPMPTPTPVPFTNITFKVPNGDSHAMPIDLSVGDRLEFRFESDLDIRFVIQGPDNSNIRDFGRVESLGNHEITAESPGTHELFFDNGFSVLTSKTVTVVYRIVPAGGR